jgi:hypothetical protein
MRNPWMSLWLTAGPAPCAASLYFHDVAPTVERDDHDPASPRMPIVRPPARQVIHSGYMAR